MRKEEQQPRTGPHHGTTAHRDPETARDSRHHHHTNHPFPPHSRPVAAQAQHRRGAEHAHSSLPLALPSHPTRTAQEHRGARSRQGEQKLPPFLLPRSRRRLLSSPFPSPPASCITPLARPSPIPHPPDSSCLRSRASPARPISPRSSPSLVCFFFVAICCASSPATSALAGGRVQQGRSASTDVFAVWEVAPTSTVSSAASSSGCRTCGGAEIHPGLDCFRRLADFEVETALS